MEHHKKYEWGDPSIWLPVRILDHYDILYNVVVTMPDNTQREVNCWVWDVVFLKDEMQNLTEQQQKDYVPLITVYGKVVPAYPDSFLSNVVDFAYLTRAADVAHLRDQDLGFCWFFANGVGNVETINKKE